MSGDPHAGAPRLRAAGGPRRRGRVAAGSCGPGRAAALHVRGVRVGARRPGPVHRPRGARQQRTEDAEDDRRLVGLPRARPRHARSTRGCAEAAATRCLDAAERLGRGTRARRRAPRRGQDLSRHAEGPAPRPRPPVRGPGRRCRDGDPRARGPHLRCSCRRPLRPGVRWPRARRPGWPGCPALPGSRRRSCTTWVRHSPAPGSSTRRSGTSSARSPCAGGWVRPGRPWAWSARPTSTGRSGTRSRAAPPTPRRSSSPAVPATCRCSCPRCAGRPCWRPTNRRPRPRTRSPRRFDSRLDDLLPLALTTAGRVALVRGDRAAAAEHAGRAVAAARDVRAADLLADALELEATVAGRSRPGTRGADRGPVDLVRRRCRAGRRPGRGADRTVAGRRGHGAVPRARRRTLPATARDPGPRRPRRRERRRRLVSVAVLGPFTVTVEGAEVPLPAWRSRQARTLVKILAAHRGRVVTRARLCDLLWPDDDPATHGAPALGPARHRSRGARPREGVAS